MATATLTEPMTLDEFLALVDDDSVDRELINGELRERPMSYCNRFHAAATQRIAQILGVWRDALPKPRGVVFCGDAGCVLSRDPAVAFGIDVAYFSREVMNRQTSASTVVIGSPVLAVEVLSPSDTQEDVTEKIRLYLQYDTPVVWIVDVDDCSVTMYRSPRKPILFSGDDIINCEPELPGFSAKVSDFFLPED